MRKQKHISIRINEETLQKIHYVAKCDGRSTNGQIVFFINSRIRDFEKKHGKIESTEAKG